MGWRQAASKPRMSCAAANLGASQVLTPVCGCQDPDWAVEPQTPRTEQGLRLQCILSLESHRRAAMHLLGNGTLITRAGNHVVLIDLLTSMQRYMQVGTMRFRNTAKVLAKCKLKYHRISEW